MTKKLAVCLLAIVVSATALTGCGSKATTMTTPASSSSAPVTEASSAAASPSASASAKTCPSGDVSGMIGGVAKCLRSGQQCQIARAAEYTQYGFTCATRAGGSVAVLTAKATTGTASSIPSKTAQVCPSTNHWPAGTVTSTGKAVGGQYCAAGTKLA